jgi:hypothetical protein
MRSSKPVILLTLAIVAALAAGCIFFPDDDNKPRPKPVYQPPISIPNVVANMATLYINQDPVEYDSVLADDYVFRFVLGEITEGKADSLIRNEEMNFAENLFVHGADPDHPRANKITLTLQISSATPDNRIGHGTWVKCVVNTNLMVDFTNSNLTVTGPAWLYFKQVPEGSGRWRLAEWADQPGASTAPAGPVRTTGAVAATPGWARLHSEYK